MSYRSQQGAALVTVLLIVAMATTVAAFMAQQQSFWQRELERSRDRAQARRIVQAGVDWARAILADDAVSNQYDHGREMWAMELPAIPVEGGEVQGLILDQQGLFNLNNLVQNGVVSAPDVQRLQRLLSFLGLPQELSAALADWMDADSEPWAGGAEDSYYLSLPTPYRAANRPLAELSELVRVRGFDPQTIKLLAPYVTVLPEHTLINVNFAAPEVLAAVISGLSLQDARQIALNRKAQPFQTVSDFRQKLPPSVGQAMNLEVSVSSQYFLVEGRGMQGQSQFAVQALLNRRSTWATVVRQSMQ